jgi:hypothetical protein
MTGNPEEVLTIQQASKRPLALRLQDKDSRRAIINHVYIVELPPFQLLPTGDTVNGHAGLSAE